MSANTKNGGVVKGETLDEVSIAHIEHTRAINFMRFAPYMTGLSIVMTIGAILLLIFKGLNLGLDFTGGTLLEVRYAQEADLQQVRAQLAAAGHKEAVVQLFGTPRDVLIRIPPEEGTDQAKLGTEVAEALKAASPDMVVSRTEFVGPAVGKELRDDSGVALMIALGSMMLFVWMRFVWRLSLGSVLALGHDAIIVIGMFSLFQWTFDLTVLAAVLAIIGYSINESIVVGDRVRENFRILRKGSTAHIINGAVTQTLSRTVMTASTTFLSACALFIWGGDAIHHFALAMMIGVSFGTYSSVFVAASLMMYLGVSRDDFVVAKVEEIDDRP
ncbi:MAG: protein translocase subunit SecF [Pseudomonadota bacterium]